MKLNDGFVELHNNLSKTTECDESISSCDLIAVQQKQQLSNLSMYLSFSKYINNLKSLKKPNGYICNKNQ